MNFDEMIQYVEQLLPGAVRVCATILFALVVFGVGCKVIKKVMAAIRTSFVKREMEQGVVTFLVSAIKIGMYILLVVIVAQILGVATSSIVALVGSAGLAVGLALQGSLANFAGGVLILVMKPFVVGDYIIVSEGIEGTVQKIDVVYTTLHTKDNRAAILPNGKLADSDIINTTKEDKRRVDIEVGIEYSQDIGQVRGILQEIVDRQETKLSDMPVNIVVSDLGEDSVTMAVYLWVHPDDYLPTRWAMLEEIRNEFADQGIAIPYRQLDVHMQT